MTALSGASGQGIEGALRGLGRAVEAKKHAAAEAKATAAGGESKKRIYDPLAGYS